MSNQFFYLQLQFTPKIVSGAVPTTHHRAVVVEVPKDLVHTAPSELADKVSREKAIAVDLARRAALMTFPTVAERVVGLHDEDPPIWYEDRPPVMNERPCDNEENGTRAWRIA
jgi:hypothetical protein